MLGRVSSIFLTANMGARPLGALLGGLIGAQAGAAACLWVSLLGFCAQAALIFLSPVRGLQRLPPAAG
jgi:predicted MFS family arabinose efflux permease